MSADYQDTRLTKSLTKSFSIGVADRLPELQTMYLAREASVDRVNLQTGLLGPDGNNYPAG